VNVQGGADCRAFKDRHVGGKMRYALTAILIVALAIGAATAKKDWTEPVQGSRGLLDCTAAIDINCGDSVQGSNVGLPNNVDYYSCVGWNEGGGEAVYKLVLDDCYIVTATISGMIADLDVFLLGSCDEDDCLAYGNSNATTGCLVAGTYYIVVDGYNGAADSFTLDVACEPCDCPEQPCCPSIYTCYVVDFNESPGGFVVEPCEGDPIWEWGVPVGIPGIACDDVPVTNVLGTLLGGDYVPCGERAIIGPFEINEYCWCMELCHFYDTEANYDGGNVVVSTDGGATWQIITPQRGYDGVGSAYGAACTMGQPIFTGHQFNTAFLRDCFNLEQFIGQSILIGFNFGADSSVFYPGWYIKWVKIGSDEPTSPVENTSWGRVKSMYR